MNSTKSALLFPDIDRLILMSSPINHTNYPTNYIIYAHNKYSITQKWTKTPME